MRDDAETRRVVFVLSVVCARSWNEIFVLLLLLISTTKDRLGQATLKLTVDLVGTWAGVLVEVLCVLGSSLGDTVGVGCLCVFNDVLVLVRSGGVLGQVRPVPRCLAESRVLQLLGLANGALELVASRARAVLLLGADVILASHV